MYSNKTPSVAYFLLLACSGICADDIQQQRPTPWLTGTLLSPSGDVVPTGHYNYEPYVYFLTRYGSYGAHWETQRAKNFYSLLSQEYVQVGLPAHFDFEIYPQFSWNHTHGASSWVVNDLGWGFDYQLLSQNQAKWWPGIKLSLFATVPIGKYQKLNPNKQRTDIGGTGSWLPNFGIVFSRLFWFGGHQFLNWRGSVDYTVPTPVHVKNYNTYGGGHHTRGTVFPGQSVTTIMAFEYTWTPHWALALDILHTHTNKTRFKGRVGETRGIPNVMGYPSSELFNLAPAIEYNWSINVGLIAGCWFTLAGRNSFQFANGVVAINIYQ